MNAREVPTKDVTQNRAPIVLFCQIPIGARFEFRGRRYCKLALSLAQDEERFGNVFHDSTEVLPDQGVQPLPLTRDPRTEKHWTDYIHPAPGQSR